MGWVKFRKCCGRAGREGQESLAPWGLRAVKQCHPGDPLLLCFACPGITPSPALLSPAFARLGWSVPLHDVAKGLSPRPSGSCLCNLAELSACSQRPALPRAAAGALGLRARARRAPGTARSLQRRAWTETPARRRGRKADLLDAGLQWVPKHASRRLPPLKCHGAGRNTGGFPGTDEEHGSEILEDVKTQHIKVSPLH